ncbi:MAG TPA: diphosphomevalonate decarboxylase [Kofleriaceae bacterium]|nr:diphosphomevalonate decarboxylase [Kofleriaceae bacterium]
MSSVTVRAHANIALVKYWGKRDLARNLPAAGSLSLTLGALTTITTVRFDAALAADELWIAGAATTDARVIEFLDLVRARARIELRAKVETANQFPTASGLASSASGFAALALAATRAAGLSLDPKELSRLARQGSGSAARSIFGGFVRMRAEADDAWAEPIEAPAFASRVRMVIAIVGGGAPKTHGSRDAMEHCAETSPLYDAWLQVVPRDLRAAEDAIARADLPALGEIAEANALAMHAAAIASRPAIIYWRPETLALLQVVRALRASGAPAWATMDAGPHVKVLTDEAHAARVADSLRDVPGVTSVTISEAGGGAEVIAP